MGNAQMLIFSFVIIIVLTAQVLCDTVGMDVYNEIDALKAQLGALTNQTQRLQTEVQSKNDQTQFLQEDVRKLNQTVVSEQQRNAVLETRVAALETKLANTVASLAEINGDLKMTKNLTNELSSDLRDGNQNAILMSDRLYILNATFLTAIESLEKATDLLKDNLTSVNIASSKPSKISTFFSYRNLNASLPFTVGQPLIFTGRISSSDPSYDPTTGIFTASNDGVYLLSTTLAADTNDHLTCYIMKNDVEYLAEVHSSAYSAYSSASTTTVVDAKAGDQLFVGRCSGNGKLSSYKSSFSGVLVQ